MIHVAFYLLVGSAIAYFMQPQIRWLAEYAVPEFRWAQVILKIVMDAMLSLTWIVFAPGLLALKFYLERKSRNETD